MNKKFFLIAMIFGFAFSLQAKKPKNYIYKTYKEFIDSSGTEFSDLSMMHVMALVKVTFATSEGKVTYSGKEIWGYLYKGKLFRSDKRTGQFAMLVSSGKICYYENGWAHTLMQKNNTKSEEFAVGYYTYVSKSLKSELTPLPVGAGLSDANGLTKSFRAKYPEYESFFKSLGKKWTIDNLRTKVQAYNKSEVEKTEVDGD